MNPLRPTLLRVTLGLAVSLVSSCAPGSSNLPLVINEVHATPVEWVEIRNLAERDIPLTDVEIGGSSADGTPDPREERTRLPAIALRPGERFVVVLGRLDADGELHDARDCGVPDISECALASFRVNASAGETVRLFEGQRHIDAFEFPAGVVGLDDTICRIPDGTGPGLPCEATPAAANVALVD